MIGTTAKVLISVFIVAVVYYQWAWDLPKDSILRRSLRPVRRHLVRLGFGHTWQLFAPRPPAGRGEMQFEIEGRDGRQYVVPFPLPSYGPGWGHPGTRVRKVRQRLVQGNQIFGRCFNRNLCVLEWDSLLTATMPEPFLSTGILDQNPPHRLGSSGKEVASIVPVLVLLADQPDIGLVHKRRCLKSLPRLLV